jgi:hypothetical protein
MSLNISKEAIRELIGKKLAHWEWSPTPGQPPWLAPSGLTRANSLPDYPNDLNAVQAVVEAIRKFGEPDCLDAYHEHLAQICGSEEQAIDATAMQRCEALIAACKPAYDKSDTAGDWQE